MSESGRNKRCSFCEKSGDETGPLVAGSGAVYICVACASASKSLIEDSLKKRTKPKKLPVPSPKGLCEHLDKYVIGQALAKRRLSVEVSNHFQRLADKQGRRRQSGSLLDDPELDGVEIEKANVVVVGPTGVGKTLLAKSLAEKLNVPFAIGDATTLTEAGYVGEDVENLILKLLVAADFDIEAAQRGIVYIDEIDKLRSTGGNVSITRDVSGQGVQQSLLKLIEGTVANVPPRGGRKHPEQEYIPVDTTDILFVCGGAFVGVEEIVKKRLNRGGMGFGARLSSPPKEEYNEVIKELTHEDLEQFGLIPELVGRLPVIATLEELDVESLKRVLVEPKNALLKQERKKLAYKGVELVFTDDAVHEIAVQADKKGTGARALRAVVADFMTDIHFDVKKESGKIVVDRDVVLKAAGRANAA